MDVPFIRNNEIDITETEWEYLNSTYNRFELIRLISENMSKVPMPLLPITEDEALKDFRELKSLDSASLIKTGKIYTKFEYKYDLENRYIDLCRIGNKSSNFFHQEARFKCDSKNSPSPYRTWTTGKFRRNLLKNLWSMKTTHVDSTRLREALSLRNYVASQFRPSAAKAFYDLHDSRVVLDFSAGWGDRLAGFYASQNTQFYIGLDPNSNTQPSYLPQEMLYRKEVLGKTAHVMKRCAEDTEYEHTMFDTIFTSPPYFSAERYSDEESQSWKRYKKFEDWLENFLFKSISNAWKNLEVGGIFAINIADVAFNNVKYSICDPMNDFISSLDGAQYQGGMGYRISQRLNSTEYKDGIFCEPIWIWKKGRKL